MLPFKNFLSEAKVSEANLEKSIAIFVKYFERKLKTKLYRFGGPDGTVINTKGIGILFLYNKKRAIRFNYYNGEITSVTLWKAYKLGIDGDRQIDLNGVGLMQAASLIVGLFEMGAPTGEYPILPDPALEFVKSPTAMVNEDEETELLTEAKRISTGDFSRLVAANLAGGMTMKKVSYDFIVTLCDKHGVTMPSICWEHKIKGLPRGSDKMFDLSKLPRGDDGGSGTAVVKVTVSANDRLSNGTPSTPGHSPKNMSAAMQSGLDNPNVQAEMEDPNTLFGILSDLVKLVRRKNRNALLVYGGPGTGKTYTVTNTLKAEGYEKNRDWFLVKGRITTPALYQTLFMHREDHLLVFDDTDSIWNDDDASNVLKAALDSYEERTISWMTKNTVNVSLMSEREKHDFCQEVDAELAANPNESYKVKLPSEFEYRGRIIFISNLPYKKFDTAVMTRSAKIDMTLTDDQMFYRMKAILHELGDPKVPMKVKDEIFEFIKSATTSGNASSAPSMRTYVAAEDLWKSGLPNWKELLNYV
jgi:hypothetical protein